MTSRTIYIIIGLIFILGAITSGWMICEKNRLHKEISKYWKKTGAKIINNNTYLSKGGGDVGTNMMLLRSASSNNNFYNNTITYSYIVDKKVYTNNDYSINYQNSIDQVEALNRITEFPRNKVVYIYYDPTNPSSSYIKNEKPNNTKNWIFIVVSIMVAIYFFYLDPIYSCPSQRSCKV